jgi:hypothetical protein
MDQSQLLTLIGSMYDKLVEDVAQRVTSELETLIGQRFADARDELKQTVAALTWNVDDIDDRIATWVQENIDVDHDIDQYMNNQFDIDDHVDFADKVNDALNDIDVLNNIDWKQRVNEVLDGARIRIE